jgi:hypothetical protein
VKELRENAEECMGWARSARSDKERSIFLQMARAWSEVAVRRETAHTGQPDEKLNERVGSIAICNLE